MGNAALLAFIAVALCCQEASAFYVKTVRLPFLESPLSPTDEQDLHQLFRDHLQSTGYIHPCPESTRGKFFIPALGPQASLHLAPTSDETAYQLSGEGMSKQDFGQMCCLVMRKKKDLGMMKLDTSVLEIVTNRFNNLVPPPPGLVAGPPNAATCRMITKEHITTLKRDGHVVIDTDLMRPDESEQLLSHLLGGKKSKQSPEIRSDSIKFLSRDDASSCFLQEHYDFLLGIASHLNEQLIDSDDEYPLLSPATDKNSLTNPDPEAVQAAQYCEGEFYVEHSDNTLHQDGRRHNFRKWTCILYTNRRYKKNDGGALRLYLNSENAILDGETNSYPDLNSYPYMDINPCDGKLLIFDSRLLHSVLPILQDKYPRQALTLWIQRPQDRPLYGDILHTEPPALLTE